MSARVRLTLSYAAVVELAGFAMLVVALSVVRFVPDGNLAQTGVFVPNRGDLLEVLLPRTLLVLAVLGVAGLLGGWILAGRMLAPLHRMYAVAARVGQGALDERVRLSGPQDEFRLLGDTFDGMLDRLARAFEEQRRFAANASHELRTPYAISRTLLDVALADPAGRDVDELLRRLDATNRRGLEVVETVLALSALEHAGPGPTQPVDLAELATEVVAELRPLAERSGVTVSLAAGEGDFDGGAALVRRLVTNLILNGIAHNVDGSDARVDVRTGTGRDGWVLVAVSNTGPVLDPAVVATLTEPFVRGAGRVAPRSEADPSPRTPRGSGLGLAIVARVAAAHGAEVQLAARPGGGLDAVVRFPPAPSA